MKNIKHIRLIMTGIIAVMLMAVSLPFVSLADVDLVSEEKTIESVAFTNTPDPEEKDVEVDVVQETDDNTEIENNSDVEEGSKKEINPEDVKPNTEEKTKEDENPATEDEPEKEDMPEDIGDKEPKQETVDEESPKAQVMDLTLTETPANSLITDEWTTWKIDGSETEYDNLAKAILAAKDSDYIIASEEGKKVYLCGPSGYDNVRISKNGLTIDFNGCTANDGNRSSYGDSKALFLIEDGINTCTIKNGTINTSELIEGLEKGCVIFSGYAGTELFLSKMSLHCRGNHWEFSVCEGTVPGFKINMENCSYDFQTENGRRTHLCHQGVGLTAYKCSFVCETAISYLSDRKGTYAYFRYCNIDCRFLALADYTDILMFYNCNCIADYSSGSSSNTGALCGPGTYKIFKDPNLFKGSIDTRKFGYTESEGEDDSTIFTIENYADSFVMETGFCEGLYTTKFYSLDDAVNYPFPGDNYSLTLNKDAVICNTVSVDSGIQLRINMNGNDILDKSTENAFSMKEDSVLDIYDSSYSYDSESKSMIYDPEESSDLRSGCIVDFRKAEIYMSNISLVAPERADLMLLSKGGKSTISFDNVDMEFRDNTSVTNRNLIGYSKESGEEVSWYIAGDDSRFRQFDNIIKIIDMTDKNCHVYLSAGIFYTDFRYGPLYNPDVILLQQGCSIIEGKDQHGENYIQVINNNLAYRIYDASGKQKGQAQSMKSALMTVDPNGIIQLCGNADKQTDGTLGKTIDIDKPVTIDLNTHTMSMIIDNRESEVDFIRAKSNLSIVNGNIILGYKNDRNTPDSVFFVKSKSEIPANNGLMIKNVSILYDSINYPVNNKAFAVKSGDFKSMLFSEVDFYGFQAVEQGASSSVSCPSLYAGVKFGNDDEELLPVQYLVDNSGDNKYCNVSIYSGNYSKLTGLTTKDTGSVKIYEGLFKNYGGSGKKPESCMAPDHPLVWDDCTVKLNSSISPLIKVLLPDGQMMNMSINPGKTIQTLFEEYKTILSDGDELVFAGENENFAVNMSFTDQEDIYRGRGIVSIDLNGHGSSETSHISVSGPGITVKLKNSMFAKVITPEEEVNRIVSENQSAICCIADAGNGAKLFLTALVLSTPDKTAVTAHDNAEIFINNVVFKGCGTDVATSQSSDDKSMVSVDGKATQFGFYPINDEVFFSGSENSVKIEDGIFARVFTPEEDKVVYFNQYFGLMETKRNGNKMYLVRRVEHFVNPTDDDIIIIPGSEGTGTEGEGSGTEGDSGDDEDIIIIFDDVTGHDDDNTGKDSGKAIGGKLPFNPLSGQTGSITNGGEKNNAVSDYVMSGGSTGSSGSGGGGGSGSGGGGGSGSGGGGGSGSGGSGGGGSAGGPGGDTADDTLSAAAPAAQGTSSPNWFAAADGTWKIKNSAGQVVTNAWVCDDVVPANGQNVWYLIGPAGAMVTAGLVRDPSGQMYSIETDKTSPYYGMLRYKNGYYNCNGKQVYLEFSQVHDATFGKIINPDGIAMLQAIYGITDYNISSSQNVHTASF